MTSRPLRALTDRLQTLKDSPGGPFAARRLGMDLSSTVLTVSATDHYPSPISSAIRDTLAPRAIHQCPGHSLTRKSTVTRA